jgi:hypothetical protein
MWYLSVTGTVYLSLASLFLFSLSKLQKVLDSDEIKQIKFKGSRVKLVSCAFGFAYCFHTLVFAWMAFNLYLKGASHYTSKQSLYITVSWILG